MAFWVEQQRRKYHTKKSHQWRAAIWTQDLSLELGPWGDTRRLLQPWPHKQAKLWLHRALREDTALSSFGIPRPQLIPACVCLYFYWLSFPLLPLRLLGLVTRKYGNSHPIKLQNIKKVKCIQVAFAPWVGIRFPGISVEVTNSVNQISKWEIVSLKAGVICQWIIFKVNV